MASFQENTSSSEASESDYSSESTSRFELETPKKKKYKRSLHYGFNKPRASYHKNSFQEQSVFTSGDTDTISLHQELTDHYEEHEQESPESPVMYNSTSCSISDTSSDTTDSDVPGHGSTSESDSTDSEKNQSYSGNEINDECEFVNLPLFEGSKHTMRSAYILIMLFVMKNLTSREGFSDLLLLIKDLLPTEARFTTSVYRMKETLKRGAGFQEPKIHNYCGDCQSYLQSGMPCSSEVCRRSSAKVEEFYDLKLLDQLKHLFEDENFVRNIALGRNHQRQEGQMTDITDGEIYKKITNEENPKADITVTFTMNTDGVALFSSSKKGSLWPVYIAINELPIKLRFSKKYLLTCLLHCGDEKPNMLTYLAPLMSDLNLLHDQGIKITTSAGKKLLKAHLIAVATDLPARAMVLNQKQFNGKFSCSMCLDEGNCPPGRPLTRFFPFRDDSLERTHQSMLQNALEACRKGEAVNGMKGASALMSLQYIDIPRCFIIDWMHNVLLGVVKALLNFWLSSVHKDQDFFIGNKISLLNQRLKKIQIPDFISRRQRGLEEHAHWKASECREWLIHFSMPVLSGVLKSYPLVHFSLLVTAMSLLTKDVISQDEVDLSEQLLFEFCRQYPLVYGVTSQTMNIHLLRHLANFTRLHGPLFCYSCFGFESMNSYLKKMVHGTRYINNQVSFAIAMSKKLLNMLKHFDYGDSDTKRLVNQLGSKILVENKEQAHHMFVMGKEKTLQRTDPVFGLLTPEMQARSSTSFLRLQKDGNIYHSKSYHQAKTRNNYTVAFQNGNKEEFGSISSFVKSGDKMYAVIQQYDIKHFSFDDRTKMEVQSTNLRGYVQMTLCPHIYHISGHKDSKLVPVEHLRRKCVLMNITRTLMFVSKPPNVVEHG